MEEFIENIKLLTNTLGHKVFEKLVNESITKVDKNLFLINAARGANGKGLPSSKGFIVLEGSEIATSTVNSMQKPLLNIRQKLIDSGIIIIKNKKLVFKQDYEFSSPSTAAAVVTGRNANGLKEWKLKNGENLREFETNE